MFAAPDDLPVPRANVEPVAEGHRALEADESARWRRQEIQGCEHGFYLVILVNIVFRDQLRNSGVPVSCNRACFFRL
jgi:hypothetical protein